MNLSELDAACDAVRKAYTETLTQPRVWEAVLDQVPAARQKLAALKLDPAAPPGLDTPTGDGMTVAAHLDLAQSKARSAPRLALVGAFSTGKSTLLNALLHQPVFNGWLERALGHKGLLLDTGRQATTGNVTELEVSGEGLPDGLSAAEAEQRFEFKVTYLSEREVKELLMYLSEKLGLRLDKGLLAPADWTERLAQTWMPYLAGEYDRLAKTDGKRTDNEKAAANMVALRELVETLQVPEYRALIRQSAPQPLGAGKDGLRRYREMQARQQPLSLAGTWAGVQTWKHPFHLVKFLQFKFPHPDFVDHRFALYDFPGLGSGRYRDDFISQEFIAEANVVLIPSLQTAVGGEAVSHLLTVFRARRAELTTDALLQRIFFVCNNFPEKSPRDAATQVPFYKEFLESVSQLLRPVVTRREADPGKQLDFYRKYLDHFIGCEGWVGGMFRNQQSDSGSETRKTTFNNCKKQGFFDCPTDPQVMKALASHPDLTSGSNSFPEFAALLTEPAVAQGVAKLFKGFEVHGGIDGLIARVKQFVQEDSARIKAEDVREHFRMAARPLSALAGLPEPNTEGGVSVAAVQTARAFDQCLDRERDWRLVLNLWSGQPEHLEPDQRERLVPVLTRLRDAQLAIEKVIQAKVDELVSPATHARFRDGLAPVLSGLPKYISEQAGPSSNSGPPGPGGSKGPPAVGRPGTGAVTAKPGLLKLDSSLVKYRFFLDRRRAIMKYFYEELLKPFCQEFVATYLAFAGDAWAEFNEVWHRVDAVATARRDPGRGDDAVLDAVGWVTDAGYHDFLSSARAFVSGSKWYGRVLEAYYLPANGWQDGSGGFFDDYFTGSARRLRLTDWPVTDPTPATPRQLRDWLERVKAVSKTDTLTDRLSADAIRRVLVGVGLLDPSAAPPAADEAADFRANLLPALTGRRLLTDGDQETLYWNPVPFDPFAGPYLTASDGAVPPWMESVRRFLAQLFTDLAGGLLFQWKKAYLERWQLPLVENLQALKDRTAVWDWIDANRQDILKVEPLEAKLLELRAALDQCERAGGFARRP